ncbi:MAG: alpha-galactosidase, partial [Clostridiales bacterium]|nr:alpha-galactosidase [Clostridiales bacterium]
ERTQLDTTRTVMGVRSQSFRWLLAAGEEFVTPEAILTYSGEGLARLSQNMHAFLRKHVIRQSDALRAPYVLINNWESTYFDFTHEKLLAIARQAAALGADLFVLDDGWFGERDSDNAGLGDWTANVRKLPRGLGGLAEDVKKLGMRFGIWIEPEMVSENSALYRAHPDWAMRLPQRNPVRSRNQLVLDITRKEVRDYLFGAIAGILQSADIAYVKWDMNRAVNDWYSLALPPERQGEMQHRYTLGVYDLLERVTAAFPHVRIEGCCGGGGRFDAGILYYCPQIWCSDNTDAYDRAVIQYGTSFMYPVCAMGAHVSAVPNHQTGRITPLEARAVAAMHGTFGYELDLNLLRRAEKAAVKEQIVRYKKYRELICGGTYRRLADPCADNLAAWQFVSPDGAQVLVQGMILRARSNVLRTVLRLGDLPPEAVYAEEGGAVYTGRALCEGGVLLPREKGDYFAFTLHFTRQNIR